MPSYPLKDSRGNVLKAENDNLKNKQSALLIKNGANMVLDERMVSEQKMVNIVDQNFPNPM